MRRSWIILSAVAFALCFSAGVILSRTGPALSDPALSEDAAQAPSSAARPVSGDGGEGTWSSAVEQPPALAYPPALPGGLSRIELRDDRYVVSLEDGSVATLTLDVAVQQALTELYAKNEVPHAALVAIEPKTGRVLAYVSHESADDVDRMGDVAGSAFAPSASVFKMVTASALLEDVKGVETDTRVCYHGGASVLADDEIVGNSKLDTDCVDLGTAFGRSTNAVFAKLAHRHLDTEALEDWSARFGYNEAIPFNFELEPSVANIPNDPLERARTAAGFWHTTLSPFHGAVMAAAVANGGVAMRPNIVESIVDAHGAEVYRFQPVPYKRIMQLETARKVADLMVRTTTVGTASRYFRKLDLPPGFTPVGKTGTLARRRPYLQYSWFVGFAPIEAPEIAVAALVCNPPKWRIKGTLAGAEAIKTWVAHHAPAPIDAEVAVLAENQVAPVGEPQTATDASGAPAAPAAGPGAAQAPAGDEEAPLKKARRRKERRRRRAGARAVEADAPAADAPAAPAGVEPPAKL